MNWKVYLMFLISAAIGWFFGGKSKKKKFKYKLRRVGKLILTEDQRMNKKDPVPLEVFIAFNPGDSSYEETMEFDHPGNAIEWAKDNLTEGRYVIQKI